MQLRLGPPVLRTLITNDSQLHELVLEVNAQIYTPFSAAADEGFARPDGTAYNRNNNKP